MAAFINRHLETPKLVTSCNNGKNKHQKGILLKVGPLCVDRWAKPCQIRLAEIYLQLAATLCQKACQRLEIGPLVSQSVFLSKKVHSIPQGYRL